MVGLGYQHDTEGEKGGEDDADCSAFLDSTDTSDGFDEPDRHNSDDSGTQESDGRITAAEPDETGSDSRKNCMAERITDEAQFAQDQKVTDEGARRTAKDRGQNHPSVDLPSPSHMQGPKNVVRSFTRVSIASQSV